MASLGLLACSDDPCELALAEIRDKYEQCGFESADWIGDGTDKPFMGCSNDEEATLVRQRDCTHLATCEALRGEDANGRQSYAACMHVE